MVDTDVPDGFKMTEIGLMPEEWKIEKLVDAAKIIMGQSPPGESYNSIGEGVPFLQGKAEFGTISPKHVKYTKKPLKIAPRGSVLISVRAPVGDVNIADIDYCIGRGLASLSLYKGENLFLFFLLCFLKNKIEREGFGSTFKAINKSKLQNFEIPFPPLSEQKKIAFVLSTIQQTIEKTEAVINATRELKKSMMKHLFTYGPVSVDDAEDVVLKETEVGLVPEEWEVVKLGGICKDVHYGYTAPTHEEHIGTPLITISDIDFESGRVDYDKLKHVQIPDRLKSKYVLGREDLVIARTGAYSGKSHLVEEEKGVIFGSYLIRFLLDTSITVPQFIHQFTFYSMYWDQILSFRSGAGQPNVNASELKRVMIPLPPLLIQQKIVNILSVKDKKIETEQTRKKVLEQLFKTLLHNLMTGKIRVNHLEVPHD